MHNCTRKLFVNHLVYFISQLKAERHDIILAVDTNKNSADRNLTKALQ